MAPLLLKRMLVVEEACIRGREGGRRKGEGKEGKEAEVDVGSFELNFPFPFLPLLSTTASSPPLEKMPSRSPFFTNFINQINNSCETKF